MKPIVVAAGWTLGAGLCETLPGWMEGDETRETGLGLRGLGARGVINCGGGVATCCTSSPLPGLPKESRWAAAEGAAAEA